MDLAQLQIYAYVAGVVVCTVLLYGYIIHLYKSEKSGQRDYEKYGKLALDDSIDSKPLVENESRTKYEKKEK